MKQVIIAFSFLLCCVSVKGQNAEEAWDKIYPEILSQIKAPTFKKKDYNIKKFGAKAENPQILNHGAIQKAIDKCNADGGGRVIVPKGTWHTGPLTLKSNVNLHLEEGSILLFTTDLKHYPRVLTRWEGLDCYNYQPLIYAYGQENIAITGKGTLDGQASNDNWWRMCGAAKFGWKEGIISQRTGRPKLLRYSEENIPVEERIMREEDGMRAQLVNLYKCNNVLIEGVTMLRSPFWVIHPLLCNNLTVRGVTVINGGPNGDGCDPESCKNVLIEDCYFDTGDDCIAIKSGRNNDGRRWNIPSENIIVRNCRMKNGHGGVVIGSEISGGYRNLFVENCEMDSPLLDRVIRIKTSTCRGGLVENIYVRNVNVGQCKEAVLKINLTYENKEECNRAFPPTVRNVYLENIKCQNSTYGVMIQSLENHENVYNINVKDSEFNGVKRGNYITGKTKDVRYNNLKINGEIVK